MNDNQNDQNNNAPANNTPNQNQNNDQGQGTGQPSYADLEKTVNELKTNYDKMGEYVRDANTLINVVYSDPDIQKMVKQKYGGGNEPTPPANQGGDQNQNQNQGQGTPTTPPTTPATPPAPPTDPRIDNMDASLRAQYINGFDERFGISKEEAKEIHEKMGTELASLGLDIRTAPLDAVPGLLEKAFKLSHTDRYEKVVEARGAAQNMTNMQGSVPTQGGGGGAGGDAGSTELTPEQKKYVNDLVSPSDNKNPEQKVQDVVQKYGASEQ